MSRAFIRNDDSELQLPERPISAYPNFVTAAGLAKIEAQVLELERERNALGEPLDTGEHDRVDRDLRYWRQRRSSARIVAPPSAPEVVRFGVTVQLRFHDDSLRSFQIVGEDEADPPAGLLSWTSPLGSALIGRHLSDVMEVFGRAATIVRIHL